MDNPKTRDLTTMPHLGGGPEERRDDGREDEAAVVDADLLRAREAATATTAATAKEKAEETEEERLEKARKERMTAPEYEFTIRVETRRQTYEGRFVSTVPSLDQQNEISIFRAGLAGGLAPDALDPAGRERIFLLANLAVRIKAPKGGKLPTWFLEMRRQQMPMKVLHAMWKECSDHEETFLE